MSALSRRAALIIDKISPDNPADYILRRELGQLRHLSPAERRDIAHAVFSYFRWLAWLDNAGARPARIAAALDLQRRFDADPASVKKETLAARAVPAWALDEIDFPSPDARTAWLRALQTPAPLWIRAQREFAEKLPRVLGHCDLAPASAPLATSSAFHYTGPKDLFRTDEFKQGLFEIQDLASQLVGHACAPQPGETWWDACCGEGGKTLHLSDLMDNRGLIRATDRHTGRLATLRKRAARAHAFNYRASIWNGGPVLPTKTKFDGVLVDAPCSGTGTWQRNPHARWTTSPDDVRELAAIQQQLLAHAAPALKPGGRLLYAVCTLTRSETAAVADAFTTAHAADFEPLPLPGLAEARLTLWPHEHNANGMFIAAWKRR
ncbi:MAG: RsmB/NOP family class I SAM-dependent RNA methyltransferase [Opitutaceae bacterium]|jgi:16S rRNA (cytosine967-C5)-methyltransferase|nr:RsmB/NOP family class I SAM-dependent RNA methyltransferase [Opitutaceae bacterium]